MVYIAFELIRHTCVLVFQSKEPNVCTHGHLAQTVSVKIELVVNPVSKVLHNITASQLAALTSYYTVVSSRTLSIAWNFFSAFPYSFRRRKLHKRGMLLRRHETRRAILV